MIPAIRDKYDRVIVEAVDLWEGRAGVAVALKQLAPLLNADTVVTLANFFVPDALGDRQVEVRNKMLEAAMAVVNSHGKVRAKMEIYDVYHSFWHILFKFSWEVNIMLRHIFLWIWAV